MFGVLDTTKNLYELSPQGTGGPPPAPAATPGTEAGLLHTKAKTDKLKTLKNEAPGRSLSDSATARPQPPALQALGDSVRDEICQLNEIAKALHGPAALPHRHVVAGRRRGICFVQGGRKRPLSWVLQAELSFGTREGRTGKCCRLGQRWRTRGTVPGRDRRCLAAGVGGEAQEEGAPVPEGWSSVPALGSPGGFDIGEGGGSHVTGDSPGAEGSG